MSPLPERSAKPPKRPPANSDAPETAPPTTGSDLPSSDSVANQETKPVLKRPVMRPPVKPASPPVEPKKLIVAPSPRNLAVDAAESGQPGVSAGNGVAEEVISRQQPISPPSEPKQFRAIGLVRGRYTPSEDKFTQGELLTSDGTIVEAVLLGRIMSLVRNHLDLGADHLWVVYPRTREKSEDEEEAKLHVQIVGVWEPETLAKKDEDESSEPVLDLSPGYEDDYFSVRGEVIAYSADAEVIIVKIQQAPRKASDKGKYFKLALLGTLPQEKLPGYFWDFQVKRSGSALKIIQSTCIGLLPPRKKGKDTAKGDRKPFRRGPGPQTGDYSLDQGADPQGGDGPRLPSPTRVPKSVAPPTESQ